MRLQDRVALITGAGRGIGRAIALAYAKEGAHLALVARTGTELEGTAQAVRALGAATCTIQADVTDEAQVDEIVRQTVDQFSTIDILVNNAGIHGPTGPLHLNDISGWIRTLQVNVTGVFLCCRAVLPVMLSRNRGKIVNLSGGSRRQATAYGVSKTAVVKLTELLAAELVDHNIQVNAMGPGAIHTRMWEETRDAAMDIGDTELYEFGRKVTSGGGASIDRAAELAVFLASDASGKLSGRLISAVTDDFHNLAPRVSDIMASETYMLRRVELTT